MEDGAVKKKNRDHLYSAGTKGCLVVVQQLSLILLVLGILIGFVFSSFRTNGAEMLGNTDFAQSGMLVEMMRLDTQSVYEHIEQQRCYAKPVVRGGYEIYAADAGADEEKLIPVESFAKVLSLIPDTAVPGAYMTELKPEGLCYRLGDLAEWSKEYQGEAIHTVHTVWECSREDGTCVYYSAKEYGTLVTQERLYIKYVESGTFLKLTRQDLSLAQIPMEENAPIEENGGQTDVTLFTPDEITQEEIEAQGGLVYTGARSIRIPEEKAVPAGARSMIDAANRDKKLNGRLEEAAQALRIVLTVFYRDLTAFESDPDSLVSGNTNYSYLIIDRTNRHIYTNRERLINELAALPENTDAQELEDLCVGEAGNGRTARWYASIGDMLESFESNVDMSSILFKRDKDTFFTGLSPDVYQDVGVDRSLPVADGYREAKKTYDLYAPWMALLMIVSILSFAVFTLVTVWLTIISGRRKRGDVIRMSLVDRIPWDLMFVVSAGLITGAAFLIRYFTRQSLRAESHLRQGVTAVVMTLICGILAAVVYYSFVRHIKNDDLRQNLLIRKIALRIRDIIRDRSRLTRVIWGYLLFVSYNLVAVSSGVFLLIVLALVMDAAGLFYIIRMYQKSNPREEEDERGDAK